jgi:rubrerythrin
MHDPDADRLAGSIIRRGKTRMPEFAQPFAGNNLDRTLSHGEIMRAIRFSIAAEYEAIQLYMQIADSTDNDLVKKVMVDVANEEKEHAGEFLRLLRELAPEEEEFYKHGYEEVEEMIEEVKKGK